MDRDSIERRDFPVGRRGYDQEAVDAHLRRIADEFEALRGRAPSARATPLAAGASEQVRLILEAAEASAAELRADAGREASGHVAKVKDAAGGMIPRLDELERELGATARARCAQQRRAAQRGAHEAPAPGRASSAARKQRRRRP